MSYFYLLIIFYFGKNMLLGTSIPSLSLPPLVFFAFFWDCPSPFKLLWLCLHLLLPLLCAFVIRLLLLYWQALPYLSNELTILELISHHMTSSWSGDQNYCVTRGNKPHLIR